MSAPVLARVAGVALAALALLVAGPPASAEPPDPGAEGAVLWEPGTEAVLFDREAGTGRPMASTTKIMTALLALEEGTYDDDVLVSPRAAQLGQVPGGATLGLEEGSSLPMSSLLAGVILVSGNDGALAVAEHVAGSEAAFVDDMNARADELGLVDTNFVNSSGLTDDPSHRASPLDLASLAEAAMDDPRFSDLAGAARLDVEELGTIESRNELLGTYPGATGVKTGFTALAGRCLVASAERDDRTLYAVVLGAQDSFADAAALLDHGFDDFRRWDLGPDEPTLTYRWAEAQSPLVVSDPVALTVPRDAAVTARFELVADLDLPAEAGVRAGQLAVFVDGDEHASSDLELGTAARATAPDEPTARIGSAVADALRGLARMRPVEAGLE